MHHMRAGLHHIALIVSDIARSREFYERVLAMRVIHEEFREARQSWKVDMIGAGVQLELFTFPDAPPRPTRPEALGLRHLAFVVSDLDAAIAHAHACGVSVEPIRVDHAASARFTFFADPDGVPIELYEVR
jgi:glyoxylase I family protein